MKCLGKLLFPGHSLKRQGRDSGKVEPLAPMNFLKWFNDGIAGGDVEMKPGKGPAIHACFNGIAGTTIRGSIQIHQRLTNQEGEEITQIHSGSILQCG